MLDYFVQTIFSLLAVLVILSIHEFAHAYAAYKLGDNTARNLGRLTINPLKHLDPIGALCMVFFHFGWAKPVPINPRNFKNPKRDFAITAAAGPLANLFVAFVSAFVYLAVYAMVRNLSFSSSKDFLYILLSNVLLFIYIFHSINIGIAIFNLIPIPPLDGSRLLNLILPPKTYFSVMRYERQIYYALLGWLLLGDYASEALLSIPVVAHNPVLSVIAKMLSLSGMLGDLIGIISDAIFAFWQLIPFLNV